MRTGAMPYAVYLEFNDQIEDAVDRIVDEIEEAGEDIVTPRRTGQSHHLTLAVYEALDVDRALVQLTKFVDGLAPQPIHLPVIGSFRGEKTVLFVCPEVTPDLVALHRHYHDVTEALGPGDPDYHPGTWLPHLTLAIDLEWERCDAIRGVISSMWVPTRGFMIRLRLIRVHPVETLWIGQLTGEVTSL